MEKGGSTYIITNKNHTTFYVGSTSDLKIRIYQHVHKIFPNSFSKRYNLDKLVYFESFTSIDEAIIRERTIKGKSRKYKLDLINQMNPEWKNFYQTLIHNWD